MHVNSPEGRYPVETFIKCIVRKLGRVSRLCGFHCNTYTRCEIDMLFIFKLNTISYVNFANVQLSATWL